MTRPLCGECPSCLARTHGLLKSSPRPCTTPANAPTKAELERHAKRFGPAGVAELAASHGIVVQLEEHRATRKRTKGPTLKERVREHVAAGRNVELIAELENLSPSRARRLVEEVGS